VQLDELPGEPETDAESRRRVFACARAPPEHLEHPFEVPGREADAVVLDFDPRPVPAAHDPDPQPAAHRRVP
jgi:hypothetical protein